MCFKNRKYCYFSDIIKLEDFDFDFILKDEKSPQNILIYDILHKTSIVLEPLRIRFGKIRYIRIYDETRYLILFDSEK